MEQPSEQKRHRIIISESKKARTKDCPGRPCVDVTFFDVVLLSVKLHLVLTAVAHQTPGEPEKPTCATIANNVKLLPNVKDFTLGV